MNVSYRGARRATAAAMATSIAVVGLLSSGCTAQSTTGTKVISGTIQGADGKLVDALLGFDVTDAYGHHLKISGPPGYSAIIRVNHCVPANGTTAGGVCTYHGVATQVKSYNWSLRLPSNAAKVWIEVYPKSPTPTAWVNNYRGYTGVSPGTTNTSTYSTVMRRDVAVGAGAYGVKIVLPKVCAAGGTTGALAGHIGGWPIGRTGKINAWSLASTALPDQGFAMGTVDAYGNYRVTNLQSGQRYGVIASTTGFYRNMVDYRRATSNDTYVSRCTTKNFSF